MDTVQRAGHESLINKITYIILWVSFKKESVLVVMPDSLVEKEVWLKRSLWGFFLFFYDGKVTFPNRLCVIPRRAQPKTLHLIEQFTSVDMQKLGHERLKKTCWRSSQSFQLEQMWIQSWSPELTTCPRHSYKKPLFGHHGATVKHSTRCTSWANHSASASCDPETFWASGSF